MTKDFERDFQLLEQYLKGDGASNPSADNASVTEWLSDLAPAPSAESVEAACDTVKARIRPREINTATKKAFPRWLGYATAAAATVIALYSALNPWMTSSPAAPLTPKTYSTLPGQRASIKLSDGTRVELNVASHITVPDDFGKTSRTIFLDGEAQFTVTHNDKYPFVVNANGTLVRDLATTFVIHTYKGESNTSVAVKEGRVAVQAPTLTKSNTVTVSAGQMADVTLDGIPKVSSMSDMERYFGWTTGQLVLRDVPLGQALAALSRWYDKDFRVSDSTLLSSHITAVLPEDFNRTRLEDIADVMGARAEVAGNIVTLFKR